MQFGVSPYAHSVDNSRSSQRTPPPVSGMMYCSLLPERKLMGV